MPLGAKASADPVTERVRIEGHIIDSLILPKVLDIILREGASYEIADIEIGQKRQDPSWAEIEVTAPSSKTLDRVLSLLTPHGAVPLQHEDCRIVPADMDGAFPEEFASTTNMETFVRMSGEWLPVDEIEMDCGIVVAGDRKSARCVPMTERAAIWWWSIVWDQGSSAARSGGSRYLSHGQRGQQRETQRRGGSRHRHRAQTNPRAGPKDLGGGRPRDRPHRRR